ncbi:MAG: NACHT domain-containing protein [Sulfurospirillaceae bacterium]|nr:NACHT domain-containing protein [Sulfurospirillaceae bacterium]
MAESGGPTTQSGIYYQNSIAALYLGKLVDSSRTSEETVESVRVEAPEAVDDVVVTYSNGKKEYIQAKESLKASSEEWKKLWSSFKTQADICQSTGQSYSLILAISNTDSTMQGLKELCDRANGKENVDEWIESLNSLQLSIVEKIKQPDILTDNETIFGLLKFVKVDVKHLSDIERDYCPNYIPNSNVEKRALYSILRDMIGGHARIRRSFICSQLLEELLVNYKIEVEDSPHWGVSIYKEAIKNEFHLLSVPGTKLCGGIDELFLWPELYENSSSDYQDFEFEDLRSWREIKPKSFFELKDFPNGEISQAVINAGAGLGKTTLLKAISYKLSQDKIKLPAFIPLSTLIESSSVMSHLNTIINDTYYVKIDWSYMCSAGRVSIFFDGLDELSNTERQNVLDKVSKHIARFPKTDFLLTVRDSSILTKSLDVKTLEIRRLADEKIIEFSKSYSQFGAKIDGDKLLEHTKYNTELMHLLRIPLFLSLVIATFKADTNLPTSRTEILEQYLDILFLPEHKPSQGTNNTPYLQEVAEYLAYQGLAQEHIGFNEKDILRYLRSLEYCDKPQEYLENLHKYGILSKVSSRWQFTYPTIQEYLASLYIRDNKEEEIINGFEKIISRPWAQTIQFALESYSKSNEIIKEQMQKDDDAFFTSLRLIARCVVNGAKIDSDTRKYLGELLAEAWTSDSSSIRESIGNLLLDGFVKDLPQKAEEYIINGWALHYGGAKILTAKKDNLLTEKVLIQMLSKDIEHKGYLHDWQEAVDNIAERALDLYLERSLSNNTNEKEISTLHTLISKLDENKIPQSKWESIVKDKAIPSIIRLVVAMKIPSVVDIELKELYVQIKEEWLKFGEDYIHSYEFTGIFWQMHECEFFTLIKEKVLTDKQIESLLHSLFLLKMQGKHIQLLLDLYNSDILTDNIKFKLNLLLSSQEEFTDEIYAVEQLNIQDIENISLWCFLIGNIDREIALKGLKKISSKIFDKKDYMGIFSSLSAGLTYIIEPVLSQLAILDKKHLHSALPEFSNWLIEQSTKYKYNDIEQSKILSYISLISSERIEYDIEALLNKLVSSYVAIEKKNIEKGKEFEWAISSLLYLCEIEKLQLSEDSLMRVILLNEFNLIHYSLSQLVKIADKNTAIKLIDIYNNSSDHNIKGLFLETIEKLSSRLGFRMVDFEGKLTY